MTFDWYKIFSLPEFLETGLVSRTYSHVLEGRGQKDILVTHGFYVSVTYEDVFLPLQFEGRNPHVRDGVAVFVDENEDVWLGFEVTE